MKGALLVLVAACGEPQGTPDVTPDAEVPRMLPMHVVVTDHTVAAYLDAADILPCGCQPFLFPAPGTCSTSTDAGPCDGNPYCPSCITDFGVELDGQRLTPTLMGGGDPRAGYYAPFGAGSLELVIAGCGHPTTRISLDGGTFPSAAAAADDAGAAPHVSWTTDATSQQALVILAGGFSEDMCFVSGAMDYTFAQDGSGLGSIRVQPLAAPTQLDTSLGHVTIWRAGDTSARFQTP